METKKNKPESATLTQRLMNRLTEIQMKKARKTPLTELYETQKDYIVIKDCDPQAPYLRKSSLGRFLKGIKIWVMWRLSGKK
jgi:hypothetical protein